MEQRTATGRASLFASGAMFDIRPTDTTGRVLVSHISGLSSEVNLRNKQLKEKIGAPTPVMTMSEPQDDLSGMNLRERTLHTIERSLANQIDPSRTVGLFGGKIQPPQNYARPRYVKVIRRNNLGSVKRALALNEIRRKLESAYVEPEPVLYVPELADTARYQADVYETQATLATQEDAISPELEVWFGQLKEKFAQTHSERQQGRLANLTNRLNSYVRIPKILRPSMRTAISVIGVSVLVVGTAWGMGLGLKDRIVEESSTAVASLRGAKEHLEQFDFTSAAQDFENAYEEFSHAGNNLSVFGDTITSWIGNLPGGGKLKSAHNLILVGKLVSSAGQSMADVMKVVSKTGWVLNPKSNTRVLSGEILLPLRKAIDLSRANIAQAEELLNDVRPGDVPDDQRAALNDVFDKLPRFKELLSDASGYVSFFETLVSPQGIKKYVLLFQNTSELRPTGGFPGTYGVVTFQDGRVTNFFADDVYNLDGQIKDLVVPPEPLQHITPNWGMRDANWFVDFPTSADKILWFFSRGVGYEADGIITVTPAFVEWLLEVVGPITIPTFQTTVTAENFLTVLQAEVEYGDHSDTNQPKRIVSDLAPLLLAKLYSAEKHKWLEVFHGMMSALEEKDIMMYFKEEKMQKFVLQNGFGGEVKNPDTDFLMTVFSNVKGSKTDAVTDTVMKLDTQIGDSNIKHKLSITRRHNGGDTKYGFYNRQNPAFVRVLVPSGSKLVGISGNSNTSYKPLLDYPKTDFAHDSDLVTLESDTYNRSGGVWTTQESGKTEFGFWMITDPREIKTIELEYEVPKSVLKDGAYELYVQKQPGLELKDFEFTLQKPQGLNIDASASTAIKLLDEHYVYHDTLERDLSIQVKLK